jgi:hypothetical protein
MNKVFLPPIKTVHAFPCAFASTLINEFLSAMRHAFDTYKIEIWPANNVLCQEAKHILHSLPLDNIASTDAIKREYLHWQAGNEVAQVEDFCGPPGAPNRLLVPRADEEDRDFKSVEDDGLWPQFSSVTEKRAFFVTEAGYMGLAPLGTKAGDGVAVLLGCAVPLVMRRSDDYFELVGDTYVCGMMEGEIIDEVDAGVMELGNLVFE